MRRFSAFLSPPTPPPPLPANAAGVEAASLSAVFCSAIYGPAKNAQKHQMDSVLHNRKKRAVTTKDKGWRMCGRAFVAVSAGCGGRSYRNEGV